MQNNPLYQAYMPKEEFFWIVYLINICYELPHILELMFGWNCFQLFPVTTNYVLTKWPSEDMFSVNVTVFHFFSFFFSFFLFWILWGKDIAYLSKPNCWTSKDTRPNKLISVTYASLYLTIILVHVMFSPFVTVKQRKKIL